MLEGHAGKNIACLSLSSVQNSGEPVDVNCATVVFFFSECLIEQSAGILNDA